MLEFPDWIFREFLNSDRIFFDRHIQEPKINFSGRNVSLMHNLSEQEKRMNLAHLAVKLHPRFLSYTYGLEECSARSIEEMDSEIKSETIECYFKDPFFAERINRIIWWTEAKYAVSLGDSSIPSGTLV